MAKKKAKASGMHKEVNHLWGWVVLVLCALVIFSVASYCLLAFQVV